MSTKNDINRFVDTAKRRTRLFARRLDDEIDALGKPDSAAACERLLGLLKDRDGCGAAAEWLDLYPGAEIELILLRIASDRRIGPKVIADLIDDYVETMRA